MRFVEKIRQLLSDVCGSEARTEPRPSGSGWQLLVVAIAGLCLACHRLPEPESRLNLAEAAARSQLISGFYGVESGSSRWTAREFSFALKPPPNSARRGGRLRIQIYIPDSEIQTIGPMTLGANIDGYGLAPETFAVGGVYVYSADIPAARLDTNIVPVRCSFDRALSPTASDGRELGAVITEVSLESK